MKKQVIIFAVLVVVAIVVVVFLPNISTPEGDSQAQQEQNSTPQRTYDLASPPGDRSIVITLFPKNNSGIRGQTAFREGNGGNVDVTVDVSKSTILNGKQFANIYKGTCETRGDVAYELPKIANGLSETAISISVDGLVAQFPLAVAISEERSGVHEILACAPLVRF